MDWSCTNQIAFICPADITDIQFDSYPTSLEPINSVGEFPESTTSHKVILFEPGPVSLSSQSIQYGSFGSAFQISIPEFTAILEGVKFDCSGNFLAVWDTKGTVFVWTRSDQPSVQWELIHKSVLESPDPVIHFTWLQPQANICLRHDQASQSISLEVKSIKSDFLPCFIPAYVLLLSSGKLLFNFVDLEHAIIKTVSQSLLADISRSISVSDIIIQDDGRFLIAYVESRSVHIVHAKFDPLLESISLSHIPVDMSPDLTDLKAIAFIKFLNDTSVVFITDDSTQSNVFVLSRQNATESQSAPFVISKRCSLDFEACIRSVSRCENVACSTEAIPPLVLAIDNGRMVLVNEELQLSNSSPLLPFVSAFRRTASSVRSTISCGKAMSAFSPNGLHSISCFWSHSNIVFLSSMAELNEPHETPTVNETLGAMLAQSTLVKRDAVDIMMLMRSCGASSYHFFVHMIIATTKVLFPVDEEWILDIANLAERILEETPVLNTSHSEHDLPLSKIEIHRPLGSLRLLSGKDTYQSGVLKTLLHFYQVLLSGFYEPFETDAQILSVIECGELDDIPFSELQRGALQHMIPYVLWVKDICLAIMRELYLHVHTRSFLNGLAQQKDATMSASISSLLLNNLFRQTLMKSLVLVRLVRFNLHTSLLGAKSKSLKTPKTAAGENAYLRYLDTLMTGDINWECLFDLLRVVSSNFPSDQQDSEMSSAPQDLFQKIRPSIQVMLVDLADPLSSKAVPSNVKVDGADQQTLRDLNRVGLSGLVLFSPELYPRLSSTTLDSFDFLKNGFGRELEGMSLQSQSRGFIDINSKQSLANAGTILQCNRCFGFGRDTFNDYYYKAPSKTVQPLDDYRKEPIWASLNGLSCACGGLWHMITQV